MNQKRLILPLVAFAAFICVPALAQDTTPPKNPVPALLEELLKHPNSEKTVSKNLETFDTLDFDVYTNQKWERLSESHAHDILVHYPDGSTTRGHSGPYRSAEADVRVRSRHTHPDPSSQIRFW